MTLREQIICEALSWNNTQWHHRACLKGIGVDCARLIEGIAKAVGILSQDWQVPEYSIEFNLHQNEETLVHALEALGCSEVAIESRQPGDVVAMQYGRIVSHVGILVARDPDYLVHAANDIGRVVHQRLDASRLARVRGVYAFPGAEVSA